MKKIKGIYIVQFENGIKIGLTNDCKKRMRVYLSPWCQPVKLIECLPVQYPRVVENVIKKRFKNNIISSSTEFITNVEYDEIKKIVYSSRRKGGGLVYDKRMANPEWIQLYPELPKAEIKYIINVKQSYSPQPVRIIYSKPSKPHPEWEDW